MSKYNKVLNYYLEHPFSSEDTVEISLSNNALSLNENLAKLKRAYPEESVGELAKAKSLLELAIPLSSDKDLQILLSENSEQLNNFFDRFPT
jgi:hypothetical protein